MYYDFLSQMRVIAQRKLRNAASLCNNMFSIFNLKKTPASNIDLSNSKQSEISSKKNVQINEDNDPAIECHVQNEQSCLSENTLETTDLGDINSGPARPKLQL